MHDGDADQTNFNDAVEHLARGFFRGFSHVLPRWSDDGLSLRGFDCLDQWNFVRDIATGVWYWNPEAQAYAVNYAGCRPIPRGEIVTFVAPYHIDYPAMTIYLRSAVGESGWAKFVERFGIPPVILTMPGDIPSEQVEMWRASAEKVAEGGSGAVPYGTGVNFCDGARGINPFKDFIHNQRELIVLMSTGGLLTSLTEAGSGTLAGGAHADTWAEVRRSDSAKMASVLNRTLADTVLDRAFPGRPHLAYFAFDTEEVKSPGEVFDDATKAKSAGYLIEQSDLEERTGYRLVKDEQQTGGVGGLGGFGSGPVANKAPSRPSCPSRLSRPSQSSQDLLAAFARDTSPAAKAVEALLKDPSKAAADALLADLPTLLPDDPAMAAIIAEAMAKQFSDEGAGAQSPSVPTKTANKGDDQPRGKTSPDSTPGSFAPAAGGVATPKGEEAKKEQPKSEESPKAKGKREKEERQKNHMEEGVKNMADVLAGNDVKYFMPGFKNAKVNYDHIAFYQGDSKSGYIHIRDHAPDILTGALNHQAMLNGNKIPETIAKGTWYDDGNKIRIVYNDRMAILGKDQNGLRILSAYESASKAKSTRSDKRFVRLMNKEEDAE